MATGMTKPVQVTSTGTTRWTVENSTVNSREPVKVANSDPDRTSVLIVNRETSAGTLWLVPTPTQRRGGFPLPPGASLSLATVGAVYGYSEGGACEVVAVGETGVLC